MTTTNNLINSFKDDINKIEYLESHVEDLMAQRDLLQKIEKFTNYRVDFGDINETYNLLETEITRLQEFLREQKGTTIVPSVNSEYQAESHTAS